MSRNTTGFQSTIRSLFSSLEDEESSSVSQEELIRHAMLNTLNLKDWSDFDQLHDRIVFATDLMELWFLRSELMHAISRGYGELIASRQMREISEMFEGLLPKTMHTRPSPLGSD